MPSEVMGIEDEYTAFCFDEACAFIVAKMQKGEEPVLQIDSTNHPAQKPSDLYGKFKK